MCIWVMLFKIYRKLFWTKNILYEFERMMIISLSMLKHMKVKWYSSHCCCTWKSIFEFLFNDHKIPHTKKLYTIKMLCCILYVLFESYVFHRLLSKEEFSKLYMHLVMTTAKTIYVAFPVFDKKNGY